MVKTNLFKILSIGGYQSKQTVFVLKQSSYRLIFRHFHKNWSSIVQVRLPLDNKSVLIWRSNVWGIQRVGTRKKTTMMLPLLRILTCTVIMLDDSIVKCQNSVRITYAICLSKSALLSGRPGMNSRSTLVHACEWDLSTYTCIECIYVCAVTQPQISPASQHLSLLYVWFR